MSGFYIGVDGKARKVKGAYIGVDGVARKIKKGYIGDENGAARLCWSAFEVDPVFANNTWENVIAACQNNAVPDTWSVGDQLTMSIDGTDYAVDIIGKNHDDYSDGSGKAPLTFQLHDCYKTTYTMNATDDNSSGWNECRLRTSQLVSIVDLMPLKVKDSIREVNKTTSIGNSETTIKNASDKLFLLSEIEVFGNVTYSAIGEGNQYDYYKNENSTAKLANGSTVQWWLRSPYTENNISFCLVSANGGKNFNSATNSRGVSFAFCF